MVEKVLHLVSNCSLGPGTASKVSSEGKMSHKTQFSLRNNEICRKFLKKLFYQGLRSLPYEINLKDRVLGLDEPYLTTP